MKNVIYNYCASHATGINAVVKINKGNILNQKKPPRCYLLGCLFIVFTYKIRLKDRETKQWNSNNNSNSCKQWINTVKQNNQKSQ